MTTDTDSEEDAEDRRADAAYAGMLAAEDFVPVLMQKVSRAMNLASRYGDDSPEAQAARDEVEAHARSRE